MYQIYDVLTGELISKKEYNDMLRIEKVAKIVDIDENKKEIYKLSSQSYGFTKKSNIERIEDITSDWKNHIFVNDSKKFGPMFAVQFAIRNADSSLVVSVATKMHASVLKRTEYAVWFQTGIRRVTNTFSRFIDRIHKENIDVFDMVIIEYSEDRKIKETRPCNLGKTFSGGSDLESLETIDISEEKNIAIDCVSVDRINEKWIDIYNRYTEDTDKIIKYAQELINGISNCKARLDEEAKRNINDGKYDDAQERIEQSKYLLNCADAILGIFDKNN
ncbi:hypothetical protein [Butyrivibrio fibrisolvens]|uniref:hypothetical protein n=1 Tax=Butyrivibrio fibrisolvens TaxID=831 RepID=UPI00040EA1C4|nr:hypothetical protein [Butyrivibrio fibrisolvens]